MGEEDPREGNSTCQILKAGTCLVSSRKMEDARWPGTIGRLAMVLSREETLYDLLVEKMTLATVWRIHSRGLRAGRRCCINTSERWGDQGESSAG